MIDHASFGWVLLILGLVIAGVGLVWILAPSIPWLGRLPGDIRIERENVRVYFPLATCLLLSLVLSLILPLSANRGCAARPPALLSHTFGVKSIGALRDPRRCHPAPSGWTGRSRPG